jgi:glycosyltransferase involved in cell wall biosynthesis
VRFLGFVADPLPYLAAADVAVLLSRSPGEGRPLAAVEAGAVGTPVLGLSGSPALEALAEEGLAGLARSGDPESISAGVHLLVSKPRERFDPPSWDDVAARFLNALAGTTR